MEIIKPIWTIYNLVDRMKNNDQQCPHILQRLRALEKLALYIKLEKAEQFSDDDVKEALEKLSDVLYSAVVLVTKFTESHKLNHMVKSCDYKLEFENLNKSLTDAFVILSGALHVYQDKRLEEHKKKVAKLENRLAQQEDKLAEQDDILQSVGSRLAYESRGYYCNVL